MSPFWIDLIIILIKVIVVLGALLGGVVVMVIVERRGAGFIQDRLGPNRVGPWGLFQPIADGIKLFLKEEFVPAQAYKPLYLAAPAFFMFIAFAIFAVIPFGDKVELFGRTIQLQIADVNIGILYIFALASLGVYGIVIGGWASNNKFSLMGGLRSAAQMISYELALGLSIIGVLMVGQSLRLNEIIGAQTQYWGYLPRWNIFVQPLGFLIFLIAVFAELNRIPFDLCEAEQELVVGYQVEYGSMKFAMFYLGEYANLITFSALMVVLFFGGWHIPWVEGLNIHPLLLALLQVVAFVVKVFVFCFFFVWTRWTFPRFRYDQLMRFGWLVLLPLAIFNIFATGIVMVLIP